MKKIVVVCGLISGVMISLFMVISIAICYQRQSFEGNMLLGYTAMILCFAIIFPAVKTYRDKYNNGEITFGKAFKIGLYIALISSTLYVISWMIDYYFFIPDFMDKYAAHSLKELKDSGASAAELAKQTQEMNGYKEMYKSPFGIILFTYFEILPVGLIISLICALILKKKPTNLAMAN